MKKVFLILLNIFLMTNGFAQFSNQLYTLKATIKAENTNKVLPFATVYNLRASKGTASNLNGYFELPDNQKGDTIVVSYIGYQDKKIVAGEDLPNTIFLTSHSALLDEVVVVSNDDYLYDMVAKVRKGKKTKSKTSKTYFFLETKLFDEPIEILESYYNGVYSNLGVGGLQTKKGRMGLKPVQNRYFHSTESSRVFSMHDIFDRSHLFPLSPLSMNKRKLKKSFLLKLNSTFIEKESKVYVVDFSPRDGKENIFSGTLWIDKNNNKLMKINLNIQNSKVHPFVPIGTNTIDGIDMEITKLYEDIDDKQFINTIDFNYNVFYTDRFGNKIKANTKAFIKAYDYTNQFTLPYFEFTKFRHEDYRNITVTPYDSLFWNRSTEFRFYDRLKEIEDFILINKVEHKILHPESKRDSMFSQLESPYKLWTKERFKMREAPASKIENSKEVVLSEMIRVIPADKPKYNLSVKFYFDVNVVQDSLIYQLYSILDPADSYYHFKMKNNDHAFMNMYFDLLEIQKRRLELDITKLEHPNIEVIERVYQKHVEEFEEISKSFVNETKRGQNIFKLKEWNAYIFEQLNIDNLKLFSFDKDI